jgi:beta-phosphoglucomutase-like phosphatase (HAD superfamily)
LGVRIADCLIFEDSVPGLAAARASGARVWDVTQRPLLEAVRFFIPAGEVSI